MNDFHAQFKWEREYWLKGADFPTWYRYYILIKEVLLYNPKSILEIGTGSGIIKNILKDNVNDYTTMDINTNLNPDVTGDLRKTCSSFFPKLRGPSFSLIPHSHTIFLDRSVALWRSLPAPVVICPRAISSAALPPMRTASIFNM